MVRGRRMTKTCSSITALSNLTAYDAQKHMCDVDQGSTHRCLPPAMPACCHTPVCAWTWNAEQRLAVGTAMTAPYTSPKPLLTCMTRTGASILETRLLLLYTSRQDGHQLHAGFSTCIPAGQVGDAHCSQRQLASASKPCAQACNGPMSDAQMQEAKSEAANRQNCTSRSHARFVNTALSLLKPAAQQVAPSQSL